MSTSNIIYSGELRTQATHIKSGNSLITDAPTDNHGKGEAFSPTDLVATALGSCMLTMMGIYAQKENIDLEGTKVDIVKVMASNPRRIAEVKVNIGVPAQIAANEEQKQKLKVIAETCPVAKSLHPDLLQTLEINFAE